MSLPYTRTYPPLSLASALSLSLSPFSSSPFPSPDGRAAVEICDRRLSCFLSPRTRPEPSCAERSTAGTPPTDRESSREARKMGREERARGRVHTPTLHERIVSREH
eukprot:scaffold11212_cov28-Tisochrysis_lutea.AAC.3